MNRAAAKPKIKVEIKSLHDIWSDGDIAALNEADEALAAELADGWEIAHVATADHYIEVDGEFVHTRTVMLRREVQQQPEPLRAEVAVALPTAAEAVANAANHFAALPPVPSVPVGINRLESKYQARARQAFAKMQRPAAKQPKAEQPPRKDPEDVSFIEALASGRYNADELRQIGNREAMRTALAAVETRRTAAPVLRLPELGEGRVMPVAPMADAGTLLIEGKATKKGSK